MGALPQKGMKNMAYPNEIKDMWELVKESFRAEYSSTAFDLWFNSPVLSQYDPAKNEIVFDVESEFKVGKLNEKYRPIIEERFASETGMDVSVVFRFTGTPSNPQELITRIGGDSQKDEPAPSANDSAVENVMLAKYTFDNFIEGESNHFARAVCLQVAAKPYDVHNPLFIHGPSGVGKTHLMGAVINELRRQNPATRVIYTTGVDFVNHMVKCISRNEMESFRNHYRSCDVLLIDDIQFIAGKESTQNEVFHTFQTLFDEGKRIILASDRPPKDINPLEERLRSRFEQGLLTDINPPNLELRVAIIKKKAEDLAIEVPIEVLEFLAENNFVVE
jgi:chromosomal replication initiator protein